MSADNKALVRRFYDEVFSAGNLAAIDEILAPDFIDHSPLPGQPSGAEGMRQMVRAARTAFPDMRTTVEDLVAEGDLVATRFRVDATHRGSFGGEPPTNKQVHFSSMDFLRLRNGRIVEAWHLGDEAMVFAELGIGPQMPTQAAAPL